MHGAGPWCGFAMSLFEGGPWDNSERTAGAHIFSSQRKLLYGADHDKVEHLGDGADASSYGSVELHRMHAFWRRNALKQMDEQVRRARGKEVELRKVPGRTGGPVWPGDLGKHHALIEEMIKLGVVTLHQGDDATVFARVHAPALRRALETYGAPPATAAPAAAPHAEAGEVGPPFVAAPAFAGARPGYVFQSGAQGLGYYLDGAGRASGAGAAAVDAALPDGWVGGQTAEGYTYYWHAASGTSTWERPTGPPPVMERLALAPGVAAALTGGGGASLRSIEEDSCASVRIEAGGAAALLEGTAAQVARARRLVERKAGAVAFATREATAPRPVAGAVATPARLAGTKRAAAGAVSSYDFRSVATFVAEAEACRAALRQRQAEGVPASDGGGGALAALAQYGDDDDDDDDDDDEGGGGGGGGGDGGTK